MEHIKRSFVQPQATSCPNHPAPSNSTSTTSQTRLCLIPSIPPPTPWSSPIHLSNNLIQLDERTCQLYPYPFSWPSHPDHIPPSPQNAPTPLHHGRSTQTSLPIAPYNTHVDLPMRDHALSPSIASWTTTQSRMPLQNWMSKSRPKHPHRLGHTLTTMSTQEPHTVASPWRSWNPTSPGYTASCSDLSTLLKWKRDNIRWPKITSKEWRQKGTDIPKRTRRIKALHPLWTWSSILERRGSVTSLGY